MTVEALPTQRRPPAEGSAPSPAPFASILAPAGSPDLGREAAAVPDYFGDLNLDQVVDAMAARWRDYDIAPFFHAPLSDPDAILYRQEVMRDLEDPARMAAVRRFSDGMRAARTALEFSRKLHCRPEQQRWQLRAVEAYGAAVEGLRADLAAAPPASRGLAALLACLGEIAASPGFRALLEDAARVRAGLDGVRYSVLIRGDTVTVRAEEESFDFTAAVEASFAKFRRSPARDYRVAAPERTGLNHIETQVLDRVALLFPAPFAALEAFCVAHAEFFDPRMVRLDREVHFYIAYLEHVGPMRRAGLSLCYPEVTRASKEITARDAWDMALAARLVADGAAVVCNGFALRGPERIMVVTGPNNGGKTTFARMVGQLHHLASLGCPVPGTSARLFHFDRLFSHFERREDVRTLRGKLQDDLVRMRRILGAATPSSFIVLNEIFSSTSLEDAVFLGRKVLERISALDLLAVCVTFLDELSAFDAKTVSLVGGVDPADPSRRTFRIERRPADGLAHALAVARKYRLTREQLLERIRP